MKIFIQSRQDDHTYEERFVGEYRGSQDQLLQELFRFFKYLPNTTPRTIVGFQQEIKTLLDYRLEEAGFWLGDKQHPFHPGDFRVLIEREMKRKGPYETVFMLKYKVEATP